MKNVDEMRFVHGLGMSNFDHSIDKGLEELLKEHAGQKYVYHAAWNFSGYVWYEKGRFHDQVWIHEAPLEEFEADTLEELMSLVNEKYGSA